jgi:hypothetical protein
VGLGEEQGGRLLPDDGWFEALERLITHPRERPPPGPQGEDVGKATDG